MRGLNFNEIKNLNKGVVKSGYVIEIVPERLSGTNILRKLIEATSFV